MWNRNQSRECTALNFKLAIIGYEPMKNASYQKHTARTQKHSQLYTD